jgi:atypical dual specificity phosphatase
MPPKGFSWIEQPLLAALAMPRDVEDLAWLRQQGLQILLSLTEEPPYRHWVNDAGLMLVHVPMIDMEAPTQDQLDLCISTIRRAHEQGIGVAVHCFAGLGRTGTVLACYFVAKGQTAASAIAHVRKLRPGSIETEEQEEAVAFFARRHRA